MLSLGLALCPQGWHEHVSDATYQREVTAYRERSRVTTLHTTCINQNGVLVMDGEAVDIAPKQEKTT